MADIFRREDSMQGNIHSIETFGSADGPGVRFIIFLKGCQMRCAYCHNPDTWAKEGGKRMSADEVLDMAERYSPYWGDAGGITVSGGEPLLQMGFLNELFAKAKQRGISTCIDTAGQPFTRNEPWFTSFSELMKHTDLLLLDLKHIDPDMHRKLTTQPNDNILDLFHYLNEIHKPIWVRHVLVPGYTDDDAYLEKTHAFLDQFDNIQRIDVLPYHTMGTFKWKNLGIPYRLEGVQPPTEERVEKAKQILKLHR